MRSKITVVGSANIDYVMQVAALPARGESVMGGAFSQEFGGKGANQAVAAARAGAEVGFVGALGQDVVAVQYLEALENDGLDVSLVRMESDVASGSALIMVDDHGENYLSVALGANARVDAERVEAAEAFIVASDWVVLQQEIPVEANQKVLELAGRHEVPVLLNYAPATDLGLRVDAFIHGLVVNETEAMALTDAVLDEDDVEAAKVCALDLLATGGHRFVVITLGKSGSVYADAEGVRMVAGYVVEAVDSTAAGDTFCGALVVALGEGRSLDEGVCFASAASALAVTKVGAQSSIPFREEIDAFLGDQ